MTIGNEGTESAVQSDPRAKPEEGTPAPAPEEPRDLNAPQPAETEDAVEEEYDELEHEGIKFTAPKSGAQKLREGWLRQADYTRKTQEVAEQRKALESEKQTLEQQAKGYTEYRKELGQLAAAEAQLEQYAQADWDTWEQQDPNAAQRGWRHYQQLKDFKSNLEATLETKAQERTATAQQETAKRAAETAQWAQQNIKGWTPQLDQELERYAVEDLGYTRDELVQLISPKNYRLLHRDWLEAKSSKPQPTDAPKPSVPAPVAMDRVATRSSPGAKRPLTDSNLSMDEYVRRRRAGEKG